MKGERLDQIAVISDIHGNLPAFEAVLEDIRRRGIGRIFCLGDLVGKGPSSDQVVDLCREVCEVTVKGNWDDGRVTMPEGESTQWNRARLGAGRLAYLAGLPGIIEFMMSAKRVRLFHASHQSVYHRVYLGDPREAHLGMFTNTAFTGTTPEPDVVGYGDIHMAYLKSFHQRILFNVGSVGNPLDITQAAYAVLEGTYGGGAPASFGVQIIRVPYDIERAIGEARVAGMPEFEAYANELRTGRYRGVSPPTV